MPRLASIMTAAQSPSRLVLSLFLLIVSLSTLSTALPAPVPAPIYRGGRGSRFPLPASSSRLARRAEQPHEVAGHARWNLGLHGDELVKRQAMANPALVNAKATQVVAAPAPTVAATPVVAAPVAVVPTVVSVVSSSTQSLPTVSSTVSSIPSSTSTTLTSASTTVSASSSSSSSLAVSSASSSASSSVVSSATTASSSSTSASTRSSPSSSAAASTVSADNEASQPASSGNIFSTSNRLFAVGVVVIIAIIVIGLLALMYVIKRVSHLPRFADARDYPHHPPAYGGILPLMRSSTDLEKTLSNASDSSRRGLLYGTPATAAAAGARTGATLGETSTVEKAAVAAPSPWTTFSSPAGTAPALPPKAVPRLLSTISETSEPPSRTPSPVERPTSTRAPVSHPPGSTLTAAAGRAKVVNPASYPRQHGVAPVANSAPAPRYKWSPPEGKESGLRWQV